MKEPINHNFNKRDTEIEKKLARVQRQHSFYTRIVPILLIALSIIITLILQMPRSGTHLNVLDRPSNVDTIIQTEAEVSSELENNKLGRVKSARVFLYARPDKNSDILTSVKSASMLLIRHPGKTWTEVLTFDGIPVWVQGKDIQSYVRGYSKLTTETANAYSKPSVEDGEILGTLDSNDILRIIVIQKSWYRVWSPRTFSAWVKTSDLESI